MKTVTKRTVIVILTVVFAAIWFIRYITLNDGLRINHKFEQAFFEKGETVAFGDNMSVGSQYHKGFSIVAEDCRIYDSDAYMEMLGKSGDDFDLMIPEKVVELTVTLHNHGEQIEPMLFSSLELVGDDWYEFVHREFTGYANDVYEGNTDNAYGIQIKPGKQCTLKIIYSLSPRGRTDAQWSKIESANMYLEITLRPVNQFIKVNG